MTTSPVFQDSDLIPIVKPQIKRTRVGMKRPLPDGEPQTEYGKKTYKGPSSYEDSDDGDDEEMPQRKGYSVVKGTVSKEHQETFIQATAFWKEHAHEPLTVLIEFVSQISLKIDEIKSRYDKNEKSRVTKISQKMIMYPYVESLTRILSDHNAMFEFIGFSHKRQNAIVKAAHHVLATMCDFVYET